MQTRDCSLVAATVECGWGLAMTSPIAIKRSSGKERLKLGFCVVIFPEGKRIPYGQRGKYKIGGALLGAHCGVPVVPVAHNAGKLWGRNAFNYHEHRCAD